MSLIEKKSVPQNLLTQDHQLMLLPQSEETNLLCQQTFDWAITQCKERKWIVLAKNQEDLQKLNSLWGVSLLNHALAEKNQEWVQSLLENKISIHQKDFEGNTPLHIAAKQGACHWIESLCKEIDIDVENSKKQTPLHLAIQYGQSKFVEALIQKGANPHKPFSIYDQDSLQLNALGLAAKQGEKECIDALIKSNNDNLKFFDSSIGSLLHIAICFHQYDLLDHLLQKHSSCFNIESRNHEGLTPLSFAASLGEKECIGLLFHYKASIDAKDHDNRLPIHHAALACDHDTIQLLAALGSKIDPVDDKQNRPLDLLKNIANDQAKSCYNLLINLSKSEKACKLLPNPRLERVSNLVFQGGGAKGLAFLGALSLLEEEEILQTIERVAGTSAGAITASLVAINYPIKELNNLLKTTDLVSLLLDHPLTKKNLKSTITDATKDFSSVLSTLLSIYKTCSNPINLIESSLKKLFSCKGLCEGEEFRKWLEDLIHQKTGIEFFTFGDLAEEIKKSKPYKHLHVYGTKVGGKPEIIHISSNDSKWKDVIVSDAVRLSMSIPGVFKPHTLYIRHQGKRVPAEVHGSFLDGGILYNFPIETFDQKQYLTREDLGQGACHPKFNKHTLGFSLFSSLDDTPINKNVDTVFDLLSGIVNIYMDAESSIRQLNPYNSSRVIEIDVKDIGALSFSMSDSKKDELVDSGKQSTKQFLETHHLVKLPRLRLPSVEEIAFGQVLWENHYGKIGEVPPISNELKKFLREPCPLWPNMKVLETHMVVLFTSHLNGTKLTLTDFVKETPLFQIDEGMTCNSQIDQSYWGVITRNTIPGCYKMTYEQRCQLLSKYDYEPPKLIEVAIATGFEFSVNNQMLFSDSAPSWMRWTQVVEQSDGDHICIGNSNGKEIKIFTYRGKAYGGILGIRRFF